MSESRRKCICNWSSCSKVGEVRVPVDRREEYDTTLGLQGASLSLKDPRIWLGHFNPSDVLAELGGSGPAGTEVRVKLKKGALPYDSEAKMEMGADGAVSKWLRSQAIGERHRGQLVLASVREQRIRKSLGEEEEKTTALRAKVVELEAELKVQVGRVTELEAQLKQKTNQIRWTVLEEKRDELCRSLCGLRSAVSLERLFDFLNVGGAADNMNFYNADPEQASGLKHGGRRVQRRTSVLGGKNGLFFTLFVMRTATSLRIASTLFGVSESTGGRAFTTWLDFLAGSLRPVLRLPEVGEVVPSDPSNFKRKRLSGVAVVVDATEIRVEKVWQTNAMHEMWSQYKKAHTAKLLVVCTPGGAICHVSDAYGGRISDVDLVKASGLIDALQILGFGNQGMHVMADRGFNGIAPLLLNVGIGYVAPPSKRKDEEQFTELDAGITRDVANLRIHVERAIGAMKQWRILDRKFNAQQMDNIGDIATVCAAMVNLTRKPFACVD